VKAWPVSYEAFIGAVEEKDEIALKQTFREAKVYEVNADMPIFFWIADEQLGVMAVQSAGREYEHGFRTSDSAIIKALLCTLDRYRRRPGVTSPQPSDRTSAVVGGSGAGKASGSL
jgi:hypothetical protein